MKRTVEGFTIIELMLAVALVAVLLGIGVPSFSRLIESNRLTTQINEFSTALNLARSEALKRSRRISLCRSVNGTSCNTAGGGGYHTGWLVFVDTDGDGALDAGEDLLRAGQALSAASTLRGTGSGNLDNYVSFLSSGLASEAGEFILCKNDDKTKARALFMTPTGRVRLAQRDSSGVPLDDDGTQIADCTP